MFSSARLARGRRPRCEPTPLRRGQLVIVDEASLAGTAVLDEIAGMAARAGAKLLLVGDHAQLQAVDAGGAFAMLAHDRDDVPELTDVRRFRADWEKTASLHLRAGAAAAVEAYSSRERIVGGDLDTVSARAFAGWRADVDAGLVSVLVADTGETVRELNLRARADRVSTGAVDSGRSVRLHDGSDASAGDVVVTRRNDRRLLVTVDTGTPRYSASSRTSRKGSKPSRFSSFWSIRERCTPRV